MSRCSFPNAWVAASTVCCAPCSVATSATTATARPPPFVMASTVSWTSPADRAAHTTLAPSSAKRWLVTRPIPLLAPVMIATRPFRSPMARQRSLRADPGQAWRDVVRAAGRRGAGGTAGRGELIISHQGMILVTGFEPFGQHSDNPSRELAKAVDGRRIGGQEIRGSVLPVHHSEAAVAVERLVADLDPIAILHLGLAEGRARIGLERVAVNV